MKLDTKPGAQVRFLNEGGFGQHRLIANDRMTPGQTYTVEEVQVGGCTASSSWKASRAGTTR